MEILKECYANLFQTPKTVIYEYSKTITSPNFNGILNVISYKIKKTKCRNKEIVYYEIYIENAKKPLKINVDSVEIRQFG